MYTPFSGIGKRKTFLNEILLSHYAICFALRYFWVHHSSHFTNLPIPLIRPPKWLFGPWMRIAAAFLLFVIAPSLGNAKSVVYACVEPPFTCKCYLTVPYPAWHWMQANEDYATRIRFIAFCRDHTDLIFPYVQAQRPWWPMHLVHLFRCFEEGEPCDLEFETFTGAAGKLYRNAESQTPR